MAVGYAIESLSRSAASGLVTVRTVEPHPFRVGDKVRLFNVLGGGATYPFMAANPYTVGSVIVMTDGKTSTGFTYTQAGAVSSDSMLTTISLTSGTPYANSTGYIQVVTSVPHNLTKSPRVRVRGVTSSSSDYNGLTQIINATYQDDDVQIVNSTTLILRLWRNQPMLMAAAPLLNWASATLEYIPTGAVVALDDGINATQNGSIGGIGIDSGAGLAGIRFWRLRSEGEIVNGVLSLAAQSKGIDYAFLRLFDPRDAARVSNSPLRTRISIRTAATTLRSALDTVIESYQGVDTKLRRYFVNLDGQMVYEIISDTQPATATAPYKIVVSGPGTPNTSIAAATVAPYVLNVSWDHDTTKRALFTTSRRDGSPVVDLIKSDSPDALGTAYKRLGAPYFDEALDYPTGADDRLVTRQQAAKAYFVERHAPILSGSFELRGAGTASWNSLGFSSGYAAITVPGSAVVYTGDELPVPATRSTNTITMTTFPFAHNFAVGMTITVAGIRDGSRSDTANGTAYNVTSTVASVTNANVFTYNIVAGGGAGLNGYNTGNVSVTAYPMFVRTGTAPSQIVTVTSPTQHGISSGATIVVSGLTGTAGTSMNGTATATVVSPYVYTYPSTGTNGTATGTAAVTATSLVPRWEPGQWVDIAAPELGLSGMYRVEQVDWRLEPGSFLQSITVTFNRRPGKTLTKLLRENQ